jgi:hypothetical protein
MLRSLTVALLLVAANLSCAHGPGDGSGDIRATVDLVLPGGGTSTLLALGGQVTVLDICAGWSAPCLENARALSEACDVVCDEDVAVISLLLDEEGQAAAESYRSVLGVTHTVVLPGPRTLAGQSGLGRVLDIPRLVLIGPDGSIVEDKVGGVASAMGIVRRVKELL